MAKQTVNISRNLATIGESLGNRYSNSFDVRGKSHELDSFTELILDREASIFVG
jgi:hypothetical protein